MPDAVAKNSDIENFFTNIFPMKDAYHESFAYVAIKRDDGALVLLKGILFFSIGRSKIPFTNFQSENIRAGHYQLSTLKLDAEQLLSNALSGKIETPDGSLSFHPVLTRKAMLTEKAANILLDTFHSIRLEFKTKTALTY